MQENRNRDSQNQNNRAGNSPRNKSDASQEGSIENKSTGGSQKNWKRDDRGSTEYEKHR